MAETTEKVKKAKAPAKPKAAAATTTTTAKKVAVKTASKKTAGAPVMQMKTASPTPAHHEIAALALLYWEQRGHAHGHDQQDWLRAEQDLLKTAS